MRIVLCALVLCFFGLEAADNSGRQAKIDANFIKFSKVLREKNFRNDYDSKSVPTGMANKDIKEIAEEVIKYYDFINNVSTAEASLGIFAANMALGHVALSEGTLDESLKYLNAASKLDIKIDSPNLTLVKRLLDKAKAKKSDGKKSCKKKKEKIKKAVVIFLDNMKKIWPTGHMNDSSSKIETWKKEIAEDKMPDFGITLRN